MKSDRFRIPKKQLTPRQRQILELTAWGAAQKEVADRLSISKFTVDNTLRQIKKILGLNKSSELSAYWFCTEYNISFDLSPFRRGVISCVLVLIFSFGQITQNQNTTQLRYIGQRIRNERTISFRKNTLHLS